MTLTWKDQTISIAFEDGAIEVEGVVAEGTGLGYHESYEDYGDYTFDGCRVDHLASGRAIVPAKNGQVAQKWIEELLAMPFDWTLPMEQLIVSPGYGELPAKCRKLAATIGQEATC
jgi:hypothetical protein